MKFCDIRFEHGGMGGLQVDRFWMVSCAASAFGIAACLGSAQATTAVNCGTGQTIATAIVGLKPAAGYQRIDVSGTCTEQLDIPAGLAVAIYGAKGARLLPPKSASGATVFVQGRLFVQTLSVAGTSFTAFQVSGISGGSLQLSDAVITGPGSGVFASNNASLLVQASRISVAGAPAIDVDQSSLEIDGYSFSSAATASSVTSAGGDGIDCYSGGTVKLSAGAGSVAVSKNGGPALEASGCTVAITGNGSGKSGFVDLSNNKGFASINMGQAGSLSIDHASITDNTGIGIYAQVGSGVILYGSSIMTGNGNNALNAQQGGVIRIESGQGVNTIAAPSTATVPLFGCYQGGKIYVDQIAGTITPAPTTANQGCLQIGGP